MLKSQLSQLMKLMKFAEWKLNHQVGAVIMEKVLCDKSELVVMADTVRTVLKSEEKYTVEQLSAAVVEVTGCFTVTFKYTDKDGNPKEFTRPVYSGDNCPDPIAQGRIETPEKPSTAQHIFTYSGWASTEGGIADATILNNITENKTVYAVYTSSIRKYTVTYYDDDGITVLHTEQLEYGSMPSYVPTKQGMAFLGWTTTLTPVTNNTSYTVSSWIACISSGICGDNATWVLDEDYTLTIFGTGEVTNGTWYDYDAGVDYRKSIKSVVVEEGITGLTGYSGGSSTIKVGLFFACSNLTSITLPSTLTNISNGCFWNANNITEVHIPSLDWWWRLSLSNINDTPVRSKGSVFVNGEAFTGELVAPTQITAIPSYQFYGWSGITSVVLHPGITSIGTYSFCATGITNFVVPDYVTDVGSMAFQACASLASIDFGELTFIPQSVCASCSKLTNVTFSENITEIKSGAFSGTTNLKINLIIPASVTKFGFNIIASSGITSVTFEDSDGWTATKVSGNGPDTVTFTASDLADPTINARNLKSTSYYQYYNWEKF